MTQHSHSHQSQSELHDVSDRAATSAGSHRDITARARRAIAPAMLLGLLAAANASGALSVGASAGCQYPTIQAAINAAATTDAIRVEPSHTYYEHLTVDKKSLTISSCPCDPTACKYLIGAPAHVSVDGYDPTHTAPVLRVTSSDNSTVTMSLNYVDIANGKSGGTDGGGISWAAPGTLTLTNVLVTSNKADYGAGINFNGTSTGASLVFGRNVTVSFNQAANSGGGIRIEGHSFLSIDSNNDQILANFADNGYGGGLEVISPASAHLSSAVPGLPLVSANQATYGGGIAIVGSQSDSSGYANSAHVTVAASDLRYPVRIEANRATLSGGGVFLKPYVFNFLTTTVNFASLTASGYRIDGNFAIEGAAIYADTDTAVGQFYYGGSVTLNPVICLPRIDCDTIDNNLNEDETHAATNGSTVLVQTSGTFDATGLHMRGNGIDPYSPAITKAAHVVREVGSHDVQLDTCLISGNSVTDALIEVEYGMTIEQCTIAANTVGGSHVIDSPGSLFFANSLIDQPGKGALSSGDSHYVHYIVATDAAGLPADATIEQQQPLFVDASHGDFRLLVARAGNGALVASQGVDFAPAGMAGVDIGGRTLDRDVAGFGAAGYPHDLGAFEMQPITDRVFANAFGDAVLLAY